MFAVLLALAGPLQPLDARGPAGPEFGEGGIVTVPGGEAVAAAFGPGGELYLAGSEWGPGDERWNFRVVRLDKKGKLDTSFGEDGSATVDFDQRFDQASAIATLPDGSLVVMGTSQPLYSSDMEFAFAKFTRDGKLDTRFGDGGKLRLTLGESQDRPSALAVYPDGRFLVTGSTRLDNRRTYPVLARFNADGSPDRSFGQDGKVIGAGGSEIFMLPGGKILTVGGGARLARYNEDGSLDASFGTDGVVRTPVDRLEGKPAAALMPNGQIVVGQSGNRLVPYISYEMEFALIRYNRDGSLDTSFGEEGQMRTDFGDRADVVTALAVRPNGEIIAGGITNADMSFALNSGFYCNTGGGWDWGLARYNRDGSLDERFGDGGLMIRDFSVPRGPDNLAPEPGIPDPDIDPCADRPGEPNEFRTRDVIHQIIGHPNGDFVVVGSVNGETVVAKYSR